MEPPISEPFISLSPKNVDGTSQDHRVTDHTSLSFQFYFSALILNYFCHFILHATVTLNTVSECILVCICLPGVILPKISSEK